MQRIGALLPQRQIESTEEYSLHPD